MYPNDFVNVRNLSDVGLRQKGGITYKYYTSGTPTFPFGHGLSYTRFKFETVGSNSKDGNESVDTTVVSASKLAEDDRRFYKERGHSAVWADRSPAVSYVVKVTNIGAVASGVSVLGFVNSSHLDAPANAELFDFARIASLAPGASASVKLGMAPSVLSIIDSRGIQRILPGEYTITFGVEGAAEAATTSSTLVVEGEPEVLFDLVAARARHARSVRTP